MAFYKDYNIITHANVHDLLWSVYNRCNAGADAFARGMNDVLGMFDVVAANAAAYMPLFVHADEPLTRAAFKRLCTISRSPEGSNKAVEEEDTLYSWEMFLLNVEGAYLLHIYLGLLQMCVVPACHGQMSTVTSVLTLCSLNVLLYVSLMC